MTNAAAVTAVPFSKLVAPDEINARGATKDGLDELAASIAAKGLIQPLAVRPADGGKFEVIDGRRRHAAIGRLVKARNGGWDKSRAVPVIVRNEDDAEALETSLVANTVRLPMHPVDQHAVFSRLVAQGRTVDEIAARFSISERTVRQHLALGNLADVVREAWKKGRIEAEVAKAFAQHPSAAVQAAAFEKLKKQHMLNEHSVRRELAGERKPLGGIAPRIVDRYLAAGGTITEDLFTEESYADDPALFATCTAAWAEDRTAAIKAQLIADGWAWVARAKELPDDWSWSWATLDDDVDPDAVRHSSGIAPAAAEATSALFSSEERARAGVVIELFTSGDMSLDFGIIRPAGAAGEDDDGQTDLEDAIDDHAAGGPLPERESPAANEDSSSSPFDIPNALAETLSQARTVAAAAALARDPVLATRLIAVALTCRFDAPAVVRNDGHMVVRQDAGDRQNFAAAFAASAAWSADEASAALAAAVATTLDLTVTRWQYKSRDNGIEAFVAALAADAYLAAARENFLAVDYFKRAPKAAALAALEEMRGAGHGDGLAPLADIETMKKGDLAGLAAERATACGWLPPALRTPAYSLAPALAAGSAKSESPAPTKNVSEGPTKKKGKRP